MGTAHAVKDGAVFRNRPGRKPDLFLRARYPFMTLRIVTPVRLGRAVLHSQRVFRARRHAFVWAHGSSDLVGCQRAGGEGIRPNAAGSLTIERITVTGNVVLIGPEPAPSLGDFLITLLSNPAFTAVLGAAIGGAIAYVSASRLATKQRRDTHKAAVRAVFYELGEVLTLAENPHPPRTPSSATYDALALPLYTDLPDQVGSNLAYAYALIHLLGNDANALPHILAELQAARDSLRDYGTDKLGLVFREPKPVP